jgi:hypothetical protein
MTSTPDVGDDDDHFATSHHEDKTTRKMAPARGVEESNQGLKRS